MTEHTAGGWGRWGRWPGVVAAVMAAAASGLTPTILVAPDAAMRAVLATSVSQAGPVSPVPASGTPELYPTATTETVRQLVQCGNTMYAVGTFTQISQSGTIYSRSNVFSFSATAPYAVTSWNPAVNGTVNSIAVTADCGDAYIGGAFTLVDGVKAAGVAEISTTAATLVPGFAHQANAPVETLLLTPNGHLLAGGFFTSVNGSAAHSYYASLNPLTGQDDGYLSLGISGTYVYPGVAPNHTEIYNQQLSHGGTQVLAEGDFTSAGGLPRQQIFMLLLGARHGLVTGWDSAEFSRHCSKSQPFYIRAAAWSPDDSTVYIADTGRQPNNWHGTYPLTRLCDAAAAFPATRAGGLTHRWINYTGCNTLLSVAADASAVYIGGHEQWADNAYGCKVAGPGSYPAPGLGGLNPGTGKLLLNPGGTAGLYSRGRGHGADDMLFATAGLWIASDNFAGASTCGGLPAHAGICFLPYPQGPGKVVN